MSEIWENFARLSEDQQETIGQLLGSSTRFIVQNGRLTSVKTDLVAIDLIVDREIH